jgi:hypothetical protein
MGDYYSRAMDAAQDEAGDECDECGADLYLGEHYERCPYWEGIEDDE